MIHHLTQTSVTFDLRLNRPSQIRQFRGAMAEHVGFENIYYHNHQPGEKNYNHRYPLIQYVCTKESEAQIIGLGEGAAALHELMREKLGETFYMNEQTHRLRIKNIEELSVPIGVTGDEFYQYELQDWLALRGEDLKKWNQLIKLSERIELLENCIAKNILGMARTLNIRFQERFEVHITWLADKPRMVYHRTKRKQMALHVQWTGNILLPPYIGLGRGVSEGFGRLSWI